MDYNATYEAVSTFIQPPKIFQMSLIGQWQRRCLAESAIDWVVLGSIPPPSKTSFRLTCCSKIWLGIVDSKKYGGNYKHSDASFPSFNKHMLRRQNDVKAMLRWQKCKSVNLATKTFPLALSDQQPFRSFWFFWRKWLRFKMVATIFMMATIPTFLSGDVTFA